MVIHMGTLTHLHDLPCQATGPDMRPCIEAHGHERLGITHMDALGFEWVDAQDLGSYVADPAVPGASPLYQMAQAS